MKKTSLWLAALLLIATPAFAYVSGKALVDSKTVYCPERITCTKDGDLSSCSYITDSPEYWGQIQLIHAISPSAIAAVSYKIATVDSGYHNRGFAETTCSYSRAGGASAVLYIPTKTESRFDGYYTAATNWILNVDQNGAMSQGQASCSTPKDQSLCPLKTVSGFSVVYYREKLNTGIKFSLNGVTLTSNEFMQNRGVSFISYEGAPMCWSYKVCSIKVMIPNWKGDLVSAGSIDVDMDNKMKIIQASASAEQGFIFKINEILNSVEIEKINGVPALLRVIGHININSNLSVGNNAIAKINKSIPVRFDYDSLKKVCNNTKECVINVNVDGGGLIGSFVIDAEDNMTVRSVESTRASEIVINKTDDHTVEINYPNKK